MSAAASNVHQERAPGWGAGKKCLTPKPLVLTWRLSSPFGNELMIREKEPKMQRFPWEAKPGAGPSQSTPSPRKEEHRRVLAVLAGYPVVKDSNCLYGRGLLCAK